MLRSRAVLLVWLLGGAGCFGMDSSASRDDQPAPTPPAPETPPLPREPTTPPPAPSGPLVTPMIPSSFVDLVKRVRGSVVNVYAAQVVHGSPRHPLGGIFGQAAPDQVRRGIGTGFVIDSAGYLLTNNHVVQNAADIRVQTESGRGAQRLRGRPRRAHRRRPAAHQRARFWPAPMGDSDALQVGEWVVAIGNPFGLATRSRPAS